MKKLIFESKSKPFTKDGKTFINTAIYISKNRQLKKKILAEQGLKNGKQFQKWLKGHRNDPVPMQTKE
jgi:hypothetical protein